MIKKPQREPITHELKTWPKFFKQITRGYKHFELRKDDRDYQVGDTLKLIEYNPKMSYHTGFYCECKVTSILRKSIEFGLMDGYCIMSIELKP